MGTELIASALLAGIVAIAATVAIERLGGLTGGLIGTLPTTIVPAAWGLFSGPDHAFIEAMALAPAGMLLNVGFLSLWRWIPARLPTAHPLAKLAQTTALTLLAWSAAALLLVATLDHLALSVPGLRAFGCGTTAGIALAGLWATWTPTAAPKGTRHLPPSAIAARGVLAATAIGLAVAVGQAGAGLISGVAAVFPAIFLTTMVALWWQQAEAVPVGAAGPMMLGSTSVALYCVLASLLFPTMGSVPGTLVCWLGAATCVSFPAYMWLQWRRRTGGPA